MPGESDISFSKNLERLTLVVTLALSLLVVLLRAPLSESLWLDECITYWATDSSLKDLYQRTVTYQGQSPLYFILVWAARKAFGHSEFALRLLSLFFSASALAVFYLLGKRWISSTASCIAVLLLLSSDQFLIAAFSARPYALALLSGLLFLLFFDIWLHSKKPLSLILWGVAFLLTLYAHYLFAPILVVALTLYWTAHSAETRPSPLTLVLTILIIGVLLLPGAYQVLDLAAREVELSFALVPSLLDLLESWFPLALIIYLVAAVAFAALAVPSKWQPAGKNHKRIFPTLLVWLLLPSAWLFMYSHISGQSVFVDRLYMWFLPAAALLGGFTISSFVQARTRIAAIVIVFVLVCVRESGRTWHLEDWRLVSSQANAELQQQPDLPIFLYSGLIESDTSSFWQGDLNKQYLLVPLSPYPINSKQLFVLPSGIRTDEQKEFVTKAILPTLSTKDRFLLISPQKNIVSSQGESTPMREYFVKYFKSHDFVEEKRFVDADRVQGYFFQRRKLATAVVPSQE